MTISTILYIAGVIAGALVVLLWDAWRMMRNARRDLRSTRFTHIETPRQSMERKADHARRIH